MEFVTGESHTEKTHTWNGKILSTFSLMLSTLFHDKLFQGVHVGI